MRPSQILRKGLMWAKIVGKYLNGYISPRIRLTRPVRADPFEQTYGGTTPPQQEL